MVFFRWIYSIVSFFTASFYKLSGKTKKDYREIFQIIQEKPFSIKFIEHNDYFLFEIKGIYNENTTYQIMTHIIEMDYYLSYIPIKFNFNQIKYFTEDGLFSIDSLIDDLSNHYCDFCFIMKDYPKSQIVNLGYSFLIRD